MLKKLSFENILKADNNWSLFKELHKDNLSDDTLFEVEKMLNCSTPLCGFATFLCTHCGNTKTIPFTCKSKLCSRCGKKHTDIWSSSVSDIMLNCDHRHMVLTIPDKLQPFFINNPDLQKLLLNTANTVINKAFSLKQTLSIGSILVLHPFGDDLKPNFHVHAIVSAGGLSKDNEHFITVNYINYSIIRKTWQYHILTALRKHLAHTAPDINPLINWYFENRTNGFVIFADNIISGSKKPALAYIARYTMHPPISNKRIKEYDGNMVSFSYYSYGKELTKTMPKMEFIYSVIQHTSSKQFKTIRRFGLYSRRSSSKYLAAKSLLPKSFPSSITKFSWRKNLTLLTNNDPLACSLCGNNMELYKITFIDKHGFFKTISFENRLFTDSYQFLGESKYG